MIKPERYNFSSPDKLYTELCEIDTDNRLRKKITMEGYYIRIYDGEMYKSPFKILKLQTDIYQYLTKMRPNNSNAHQSYLELYQHDNLKEYLSYFSNYNGHIITRIDKSVKTLSADVLNLYHHTRKKRNKALYSLLPEQYRKVLYEIHGLFMAMRSDVIKKKEIDIDIEQSDDLNIKKSITIHNVYYYLKNLEPEHLRKLFEQRPTLIESDVTNDIMAKNCVFTKALVLLMFPPDI